MAGDGDCGITIKRVWGLKLRVYGTLSYECMRQVAGDGDCGMTMKRGAARVLQDLALYPSTADGVLLALAESVKESMGGSSGELNLYVVN